MGPLRRLRLSCTLDLGPFLGRHDVYEIRNPPRMMRPEKLCPFLCPPMMENGLIWYESAKRRNTT